MFVSFSRASGPYDFDDNYATKASTAIAVGDVLDDAGSGLQGANAGDALIALALNTKAVGDATQDGILTMLLYGGRAKFYGEAEAGTFVRGTDIKCDLNSPNGLDGDTASSNDFLIEKIISTTQAVGYFLNILRTVS